jgi:anti-anti-sigma factor
MNDDGLRGMLVCVSVVRGVALVKLAGDLTAPNVGVVRTELVNALGSVSRRLILDLAAVRSLDAAGVAVIEGASTRAWRRGGWLRLVGASGALLAAYPAPPVVYADVEQALAGEATSSAS